MTNDINTAAPTAATPASAWKRKLETTTFVTLPSEQVVRVRDSLDLQNLIREGVLDSDLVTTLNTLFSDAEEEADGAAKVADIDIRLALEIQDILIASLLVEPAVYIPKADEYGNVQAQPADTVHIKDLSEEDRDAILLNANVEVEDARKAAKTFQDDKPGDDDRADRADVGHNPKSPARPKSGDTRSVPNGHRARKRRR